MGPSELVTFITKKLPSLSFAVEYMIVSVPILVVGFFKEICITVIDVQSWLKMSVGFVCIFFTALFQTQFLSIRSKIEICTVLYSEQSFELYVCL